MQMIFNEYKKIIFCVFRLFSHSMAPVNHQILLIEDAFCVDDFDLCNS